VRAYVGAQKTRGTASEECR